MLFLACPCVLITIAEWGIFLIYKKTGRAMAPDALGALSVISWCPRVSPPWVPHAHLPESPCLEVRSGHGCTPVLFVCRLDMPGMASDGRGQQVSACCPWTQAQFQCVLHSFEGPKRGAHLFSVSPPHLLTALTSRKPFKQTIHSRSSSLRED